MTTSFKLPTSVISNAPGVNGWLDPNNILLVDNEFAVASGSTNILEVGNFLLNIPQDSSITNFTVQIKGYRGNFNTTLQIYAVDNTSGVELAYPLAPFQGFSGTNTLYTLPSSLFGTTWTVDQANNIKLKFIADGELHLDACLISADYVPTVTPVPPLPETGETVCHEFVEAIRFNLAQSMTADDLFCFVQSFNLPDGVTPIQITDFYGEACLVFDQGVIGLEEQVIITNIEHNYQGTGLVRLSFGNITNRGLKFIYPYDHDINLCRAHDGTAELVISNSARFYDRFLKKCQIDALVSAPITIADEDIDITNALHRANFTGQGVTVTTDPSDTAHGVIINIPGIGVTPPSVVATSSATSGATQVPTLTWSHVSSGLNRLLVVQISTEAAATVTGVTFNGVALSLGISTTNGTIKTDQWYLIAPPVGTYNIVVSVSPNAYVTAGAETFNSVDQASPIGATAQSVGNSTSPAGNILTTTDNSLIVDSIATGVLPMVYTVGAGQIENWKITANPAARQGASSVEPAGTQPDTVTMSWAITQSTPWAVNRMEIKGLASTIPADDHKVAATGADTTPNYLDDKIEVVAGANITVNKVIINPGANEKIQYQIVGTGGGSGGSYVVDQTPDNGTYGLLAGAVDGVNDTYTVSAGVYITGKLFVFLNGLVQLQGASDDFIELVPGSGTFQFNTPPAIGDIITAVYADASVLPSSLQVDEDGVLIESGVTVMNFKNGPTVTSPAPGEVDIDFAGLLGGGSGGTKIAIDTSSITASAGGSYTIPIPGGTLGTNDAIRYKLLIDAVNLNIGDTITATVTYGGQPAGTATIPFRGAGSSFSNGATFLDGLVVATGATNTQIGYFNWGAKVDTSDDTTIKTATAAIAGVDSTIAQDLVITLSRTANGNVSANGIIVEKITEGSGSNVNNVSVFEDFTYGTRATDGNGDTILTGANYGCFNTLDGDYNGSLLSGELDHPGILSSDSQEDGFSMFTDSSTGSLPTTGSLSFQNDFEIEVLMRLTYAATSFNVFLILQGLTEQVEVHFDGPNLTVTAGGAPVTVATPATGTWFKMKIQQVAGVLTVSKDGVTITSGTPGFTEGFGMYVYRSTTGGSIVTTDVDYVSANYQLNR